MIKSRAFINYDNSLDNTRDRNAWLIWFGLVLEASASALVEVRGGYHKEIGIPLAEEIRAYEEGLKLEDPQTDRVVGGVVAPAGAHPYFAGLLIGLVNVAGNSVCGSTLLSANRLETAAHCWRDNFNQAWQFVVILGTNFLYGTRIATSQVVVHLQYNTNNFNNDIAMIYLPTNVFFTTTIQPIDIPSSWELWGSYVGK